MLVKVIVAEVDCGDDLGAVLELGLKSSGRACRAIAHTHTGICFVFAADAGEKLVLSVDVDEQGNLQPNAVVEGAEFEGATLTASFTAPHMEDLTTAPMVFYDTYDLTGSGLENALPNDNYDNAAALVYVVLLPSIVAYYCWDRGVARAGAVLPMYFVNLTPVFAAALATAVLDEPIGLHHVAGGALILTGIHLANRPAG